MKKLRLQPDTPARAGLAVLGGLLTAAAFPKFGVAGFAWVAPGILLAAGIGADGQRAFRFGYLAGMAHYLVSLSWLLHIPVIKIAPISAWLALSGYLSLYPALWVWLSWRTYPAPIRQEQAQGEGGFLPLFDQFLAAGWGPRAVWALSSAGLWVAWEMGQARIISGFPWNLLGASQYRMVPLIQVASLTGVYGVSFLAVWFAVSGLCAVAMVLRRSEQSRRWLGELALPLLAVTAVVWVGLRQTVQPLSSTPPASLRVALVQPSIPQQWIWSPAERARRFDQLLELSAQAMTNHPDLLVWPEAAAPGYVRWETNVYQPITNLVRSWHTWLILGGDDYVLKGDPKDPEAVDEFNSAFLVDPQGGFRATYRKRRLVIFGEFLPFHRWLPFLERWTGMGSFTPGREAVPFVIAEKKMRTFVLICFEDVFPHLTREYVDDDTDFLLNLTNNGWFGESAAQWQHAASAVFRAVENGVPLVRCANNGLTCFVDVHGRIWEEYFPGTTDIYGVGIKLVTVPLLDGKKRAPTFYRRYGDLFGWSCVAWSVLVAGRSLLRRRGDC